MKYEYHITVGTEIDGEVLNTFGSKGYRLAHVVDNLNDYKTFIWEKILK